MFKLMKWGLLGGIALVALNAASDGRLAERARAAMERLERERSEDLSQKISKARQFLEKSEQEIREVNRDLLSARHDLEELNGEIGTLEERQRKLLAQGEYLDDRLSSHAASYEEMTGRYSRNEMENIRRRSWRDMQLNEAVLTQKTSMREALRQSVTDLERELEAKQQRWHELRVEITTLETRLRVLEQDPRWRRSSEKEGKGTNLDRAEKLSDEIRSELQLREELLRTQGSYLILPEGSEVGPQAENFREKMVERYGDRTGSDT